VPEFAVPSRARSGRRLSGWLWSLPAVLLAAAGLAWAILTADVPPPDLDDLALERQDVPADRNGYVLLAAIQVKDLDLEELAAFYQLDPLGPVWDGAVAADFLARNRGPLEAFEEVLSSPHFQAPAPAPFLSNYVSMNLGRLTGLRMRSLLERGARREAIDEALKVVRLGQRLEAAKGSFTSYLFGHVVRGMGTQYLHHLALRHDIEALDIVYASSALVALRPDPKTFDETLRAEFATTLDDLAQRAGPAACPYDDFWRPSFGFCPNRTRKELADDYRRLRRQAALPAAERSGPLLAESGAAWRNASGRRYRELVTRSWNMILGLFDFSRFHFEGVRAIVALRRHRLERGDYPERLEALVPDYLGSVPLDPWDGAPVRYSREARLLWSIHADGGFQAGAAPAAPARHPSGIRSGDWVLSF
jgi:hypothetical protein